MDNLNKMDEKLEAIRREIPNIDIDDFSSLVDSKFKLEAKLNDLLERANILSNELEETKKVKNCFKLEHFFFKLEHFFSN